jgi:hypothetical protein
MAQQNTHRWRALRRFPWAGERYGQAGSEKQH